MYINKLNKTVEYMTEKAITIIKGNGVAMNFLVLQLYIFVKPIINSFFGEKFRL